jgi:DNA repair exonuclease SbcCD ATPase subunit
MKFSEYILEGRVDDFKVKYGKKFTPDNLDKITKMVTPKYLNWVGKFFDEVGFDTKFKDLVGALKRFETISTNLPLTDINQYKSLDELINAIKTYDNRVRRDVKEVKGGKVVYDDGRFFVVNPLNYESSCYYGKGTKWCTAAETDTHFKRYNQDGKLFYIIDRTKPSNDPNYKVALLKKFDGDTSFYDAKDDRVDFDSVVGNDKFQEIIGSVDKFLQEVYPEQLKIYADAIAAKKEKERLESLRIQQEMRAKLDDAQDRRESGVWSGDFNYMEEMGFKAHALLKWLDDYDGIEVRQPEDNAEMIRLEAEIQRLDDEYDNSEDPRPELLDEKSELEDELEELQSKIDVYNIVPTGDYYDMTEFEVLADGYRDKRYAVGTERETQQSAYDSVESLIDDIGYEGFSQSFLEDYIDTDDLKDYVYDFYYDDINEQPESYLSDEDRELSDDQEEQIRVKQRTISKLQNQIDLLEKRMDGQYDDEISEKIDELREMISDLEYEIDEIKENPEGDFPEELIEKEIQNKVDDVLYDPGDWIRNYGLDLKNFINQREFINGVIDADGIGHTLNRYDGSDDEISVNGVYFHVMRID